MGRKRNFAEINGRKATKDPRKDAGKADTSNFGSANSKRNSQGAKSELTFAPRPDWHAAQLPPLHQVENVKTPPRHILEELRKYGYSLLEAESATYDSSHFRASSSHKFLSTIMASGTLEDKVSALTLLVQESPVHTRKAFENLVNLSQKKNRSQALMALAALKDLLGQGVVLPPDRKLRAFNKQPSLLAALNGRDTWEHGQVFPAGLQKIHLISFAYEDWLKKTYFVILQILEEWCNDEVQYSRSRAVTFIWELLKEKPEQEENLLRLLVNKLGDTEKKIASRASYLLLQLQTTHPMMKGVIISAIESEFLFRPGQSNHAKYYAIITLNQTILCGRDQEVANRLLQIYFSLFVEFLKKIGKGPKEDDKPMQGGGGRPGKKSSKKKKQQELQGKADDELRDKIIAQVLTGVNRALPYAKTDEDTFGSQIDTIFAVTHSSNFNTSIQALILLQQMSASKHSFSDRYYRTLYESLLDPRLLTSSKQIMYLNLLYRSLKADLSIKRVKAFVKRLLQVSTLHEPPFVCGILFLIGELSVTFPSLKSMLYTPEENDEETEYFVDAPENDEEGMPKANERSVGFRSKASAYDPRKRDPEHSKADQSCLWEVLPFPAHFHPSVSLFATRLLHGQAMPPKPDPTLHTLMHFLDRFAYRNPKSKTTLHGSSIMQPLSGADTADRLIKSRDGASREAPLNTESFWAKKIGDVPVDEVFFHQYFDKSGKSRTSERKKKKDTRKPADGSDEGEDEEGEIWKALVNSKPDIEGSDEGDDSDVEGLDDGWSDEGTDAVEEDEKLDDVDGTVVEGAESMEDGSEASFDAAELESDDDALVDSDADVPDELEENVQQAAQMEAVKESEAKDGKRNKKRKLKHLPTFASFEDYAKLLGDDDEEM